MTDDVQEQINKIDEYVRLFKAVLADPVSRTDSRLVKETIAKINDLLIKREKLVKQL